MKDQPVYLFLSCILKIWIILNIVHNPVKRTKTYRIPASLKKQKSDKPGKKSAPTKQEHLMTINDDYNSTIDVLK